MCADVAGYSAMMERDEEGTMETLRAHRATMRGFIERHRGRIANTAGDSVMAEFPSVLEAVTAAAEIQQELEVRNATLDRERQMQFRIGINLGDVMVEGDDLFGEGVNIAARLESVAEPGGICISGTVHDQVKNKLSLGYEYLGARQVKNISEEIPVYRVDLGTGATSRGDDEQAQGDGNADRAGLAGTLGSLGERIGRMIDENVESEILADRTADKVEGKEFAEFVKNKVEQATEAPSEPVSAIPVVVIRSRKPGTKLLSILIILTVIDVATGDGWWVQWPAIVAVTLIGLSNASGVWNLAVLAGGLALFDWALGGEWWSQWVALGVGAIIALRLVSRMGRRAST